MDRNAASIDGRNARWSYNGHSFVKRCFKIVQKSCFPGSGFPGQENIFIGGMDKLRSNFQWCILIHDDEGLAQIK